MTCGNGKVAGANNEIKDGTQNYTHVNAELIFSLLQPGYLIL